MAKEKESKKEIMSLYGYVVRADYKARSFTNKQGREIKEDQPTYHLDIQLDHIEDPIYPDDKRYTPAYLDSAEGEKYANVKSQFDIPVVFRDDGMITTLGAVLGDDLDLYKVPCVIEMIKSKGNLYPSGVYFFTSYGSLEKKRRFAGDRKDFGEFKTTPPED